MFDAAFLEQNYLSDILSVLKKVTSSKVWLYIKSEERKRL